MKIFSSIFTRDMQFARLRATLLRQISRIGSGNGFQSNFYSSNAMPRKGSVRPPEDSNRELFRRLGKVSNPNLSIVPVLDQWSEQGRSVEPETLRATIKKLRYHKRFHHALEVSMWMTDKRAYELHLSDVAIRLGLISKAKGIEQAEQYFNNLPQELKVREVYSSLLKCFAAEECVKKAEEVKQKMRDLGFAMVTEDYNVMLILYYKTEKMEKFRALLKEMEVNDFVPDKFTLGIQLSAYAAVMDIEEMDKIVMIMESNPKAVPDFTDYSVAATGYRKAGLSDKAFQMLKKAEARLTSNPGVSPYNHLLTQYANMGMKDEVLRIWSEYKKKYKVHNKGYSHFLNSLVKLGDFEKAEKIFNEWDSLEDLTYDMNVPNIMVCVYSRKGLIEKAEAFIDRAVSRGGKPNAWTWYHLVEGYFQNEQPQKAVEMMKKTIVQLSGMEWEPVPEVARLKACLEYLKRVGDTEGSEEFVKLLVDKDIISLEKLEELCIDQDEMLNHG